MTRFDHLIGLWEEGARRMQATDGSLRRTLDRVVAELLMELQRKVGVTFTTQELADFYISAGTDWCFEIAYRTAPSEPEAWDTSMLSGAAFTRYVRGAIDYGGGVRKHIDEQAQGA